MKPDDERKRSKRSRMVKRGLGQEKGGFFFFGGDARSALRGILNRDGFGPVTLADLQPGGHGSVIPIV